MLGKKNLGTALPKISVTSEQKNGLPQSIRDEPEVWRQWPTNTRYHISSYGRVWCEAHTTDTGRHNKARYVTQSINQNKKYRGKKYYYITIHHPTKKLHKVHRLVAELFCDKPPACDIVNHLDQNGLNNYYKNLEWTDHKGNNRVSHANTTMTIERAHELREEWSTGKYKSKAEMARELDLGVRALQDLLANKRWAE